MAAILHPDDTALRTAARIIQDGGLVAFPTETVYGLGACVCDAEAVAKIFEVKRRPSFDPLIVHVAALSDVERVCQHVNDTAQALIERFWPGPLTFVLPKSENVPDIVTSGLETVAVRMPVHPAALRLICAANVPIAAPSANPFSHLSPTTADHVADQLGAEIEVILDGGRCPVGVESTIIDLSDEPTLLRPGGMPLEEIERVIGAVRSRTIAASLCPPDPIKNPDRTGDEVIRLESMKMETGIASPCDGYVEMIPVVPGQTVDTGDMLIRFTKQAGPC